MATLDHWITNYLNDCRYRKHLDVKTLRAYRSDVNAPYPVPFLSFEKLR